MALRDRFPTIPDLMQSTPEDLGAELVLHLQTLRTNGGRVADNNLPGDLAYLYGQRHVDHDLAGVIAEALWWARSAGLIIRDPTQAIGFGWLQLSRSGRTFTRDALQAMRLRQLLPDFMLHPEIRQACLEIFNTGRYEAAVFEAFKTVEIAVREAAGFE
jgi:hypothetical protein